MRNTRSHSSKQSWATHFSAAPTAGDKHATGLAPSSGKVMSATAMASIGDHGALNTSLPTELSDVWIDRDLSWLDFNQRVLAEALDERTPLLERAKFLAIFTSNLDEFFMKRVSVLRQGGAEQQRARLQQVREKLLPMLSQQADCYRKTVVPGLAKHGVLLRRWDELTARQQEEASEYFDSRISAA